jgi:hypothetical protein
MNKTITRSGLWLLIFFALIACLLQSQAQAQEQELPFETVAQKDSFIYRKTQPAIIVIANANDVDGLDRLISGISETYPELMKQLRQQDYNRVLVVLALYGYVGSGGHNITIERVIRKEDQINLFAQFRKPLSGTAVTDGFTSPYHVIAISKSETWRRNIHFVLLKDNISVAGTNHFVL